MEEQFAAQLEWWGNSTICLRFDVLVVIEEAGASLTARGALTEVDLADLEVEEWELLCEASPYFRLVFADGSAFEVVVRRADEAGGFSLAEYVVEEQS